MDQDTLCWSNSWQLGCMSLSRSLIANSGGSFWGSGRKEELRYTLFNNELNIQPDMMLALFHYENRTK